MSRRAPSSGYDFQEKDLYRRWVWNAFAKGFRSGHLHKIAVAMMPSSEGLEIEVALKKGFSEQNIHAIDDNPAIVATLKRRFPGITSYGVDVARAFKRMAESKIYLSACNLDLTNCVGRRLSSTMECVADSLVMNPETMSYVSITMQRGREMRGTFSESIDPVVYPKVQHDLSILNRLRFGGTDPLTVLDMGRVSVALGSFFRQGYCVSPYRVGIYDSPSSHLTMLFVVATLVNPAMSNSLHSHIPSTSTLAEGFREWFHLIQRARAFIMGPWQDAKMKSDWDMHPSNRTETAP